MSRKTILRVNVFYYLSIFLLAVWGLFAFPQYWPAARWLIIGLSAAYLLFCLLFSKCPHCRKGLAPGYKGTTCPHCGEKLY